MRLDRAAVLARLRSFYRIRDILISERMLEELADLCGEQIIAAMAVGALEAIRSENEETR